MIEEFTLRGASDFSQRYRHTFGWYLQDSGDKILVKVDEVRSDKLHFSDEVGIPYVAYADKGNRFEFLPVERATYNTQTYGPVATERIPARQYKRGICTANTQITVIHGGLSTITPDFDILTEIFASPLPDAAYIPALKNKGLAVGNLFILSGEAVRLYHSPIGSYKQQGSRLAITLTTPLFQQELSDALAKLPLEFDLSVTA